MGGEFIPRSKDTYGNVMIITGGKINFSLAEKMVVVSQSVSDLLLLLLRGRVS